MTTSGVYRIICRANGKFYVGSTKNFARREREHFRKLTDKTHANPKLRAAWSKYGSHAFEFRVLLRCDPAELLSREQHWIDKLRPFYNVSPTAGRPPNIPWTEERRNKAAKRGAVLFRGKSHTQETKDTIAQKAKLRFATAGHPLQGTIWKGDRAKQAETMRRLHKEGRLVSHAKLHGISDSQKQKMRATIAKNGGRRGPLNGHYKPELLAVVAETRRLLSEGASVKQALKTTGLARSTYYKRIKQGTNDEPE